MEEIRLVENVLPYETAEELKQLRSNILFCGDDKKVIMLTSCVSGEGKSTTSLMLAKSLAEIGKLVLLIDCDLRKSVIKKKVASGKIKFGLSHLLSGQCKVEDVVYSVELTNLNIIPCGKVPPNPVELLLNNRMKMLIDYARSIYDYVIIDCPPLGMVSDAAAIAPKCDGAVMVVSAGEISYKFARRVKEQLEKTSCPILGVILNKVDYKDKGRYGHYGKYYGHYGHYGEK